MALVVKNAPANSGDAEIPAQFLDWEDSLEKEIAPHSTILALKIP